MQLKQKKNRRKLTTAILLTGCFVLTTASAGMAEGTKVKLDFTKIQQALKKGGTASVGTASVGTAAPTPGINASQMAATISANMPGNAMQAGSMGPGAMGAGTMGPDMSQMIKNTMGGDFVSSDIMGEMQKKIMAENMGSMQESIQASMMKSMRGSAQPTGMGSLAK